MEAYSTYFLFARGHHGKVKLAGTKVRVTWTAAEKCHAAWVFYSKSQIKGPSLEAG